MPVKTSSLSGRLTISIIVFSSLITLLLTGIQLYTDYHHDMRGIQKTIDEIELGIVNSISANLWMDDREEIRMLLNGISALPDINYAAIFVNNALYSESGRSKSNDTLKNRIPITYTYNNQLHHIATLYIQSDLDKVHTRLINRFWIILASNALKTFLVVIFIFVLFQKVLIGRLQHIASFIQSHNNNDLNDRITPTNHSSPDKQDEIDEIINAINSKQENIEAYVGQLRQSEEKNRLLLNASGEGIFGLDEKNNITFINPKGLQLLDYTENESLVGKPLSTITSIAITQQDSFNSIHELLKGKFIKRDGDSFLVEYTSNPIINQDKFAGSVITFRDITEREATRKELISAKEHAESSSKAKSLFLSSMSHELRTPMNAILGFGQLLRMDPELSEKHKESVSEILDSGKHLLTLIDEVLDLARIESGKLHIDSHSTTVAPLISECISLMKPLAESSGINLVNQLEAEDNHALCIDPKRFKQIIINILSNAIKYNNENGKVVISNIFDPASRLLRIIISDTGKGIPQKELDRLFTPFERLGEYSGIDGTGIGLTISKNLVEAMQGKIGVSSTEGQGTDFWIEFPVVDTSITSQAPDARI